MDIIKQIANTKPVSYYPVSKAKHFPSLTTQLRFGCSRRNLKGRPQRLQNVRNVILSASLASPLPPFPLPLGEKYK